ncbi:MAG: helix-turn-helix domain-containing protein [Chloroflexota bacterium]|nr:helix-turn-helix domain-containing protein [Chloroflexota bacterium]
MEDVVVTLGKRIRELRLRTGRSQEKFAAAAGLDRTYYAGIERGERNPSVKQLAKIAAALEVPIGMLFNVSEGDQPKIDISLE